MCGCKERWPEKRSAAYCFMAVVRYGSWASLVDMHWTGRDRPAAKLSVSRSMGKRSVVP